MSVPRRTVPRRTVPRRSALVAVALLGSVVLSACGDGEDAGTAPEASTTQTQDAGDAGTADHAEADVAFAQGMIPHHAQAIEMSDVVLGKDGVDERVLALAEAIKVAQGPEIDRMTNWLEEWGAEVPDTSDLTGMDHSAMGHGGGGMMSAEDMMALGDADGDDASRLFLQQMIMHHRGALVMAETELEQGRHPEAVELARTIIDSQQAEIEEMEALLGEL
ncbi:DUF305 domain-containing protein [Thalassiella azotivora]